MDYPRLLSLCALWLVGLLAGLPAAHALNVVIKNQNAGYLDSQVYFTFRDAAVTGTINGQTLVRDQTYAVTDQGSGIVLTQFTGGRIYFSLGAPLTGTGDPEPINSTVANWGVRFDKMELTFGQTNHYGVANLTAIDYFAIPLAVKTYAGTTATGTPKGTLTYQQPGNTITANLAALANNDPKTLLSDKQGNFLRVLGPTLAKAGVYPSFQPYLAAVQTAGQVTQITGLYSRAGTTTATKTQRYQFTATFTASGNLQLLGGGISYAGGPTVGLGHTIVILAADLAAGVYSANPGYTVDGAAANIGDNDVYSAVVRDILTGYALGFVNSPTVDPLTGKAFKDEPSENWWKSAQAFGYLQSNPDYYDRYAAYLQTISNAYGHPFSDRWQAVQVSLDPSSVGTMEIDVLPDAALPAVTSAAQATAQAGSPFQYQITAGNSPTAFGAAGLPDGLTVQASTGLISGTPTVSGRFSVTLSATNAGGTGKAVLALAVNDSFAHWRTANFTAGELQNPALSGPSGDPTGAGVSNLLRYALGIPARQAGVAGLPVFSNQTVAGVNYPCLSYTCNPLATGVNLAVQSSTDLAAWSGGSTAVTELSRTTNADGTQTVVTRSNQPFNGAGRQFLRLNVTLAQ